MHICTYIVELMVIVLKATFVFVTVVVNCAKKHVYDYKNVFISNYNVTDKKTVWHNDGCMSISYENNGWCYTTTIYQYEYPFFIYVIWHYDR